MNYGLRKGLEDIATELKGIRNILSSMWHSRYGEDETNILNPQIYADEYVSTEECAKRLNVSDQTIRNWISIGRKTPDKGWVEGVHYVNISPDPNRKAVIRIPWNQMIHAFCKNRQSDLWDFIGSTGARSTKYKTTNPDRLV
jgi:hypothetical protein